MAGFDKSTDGMFDDNLNVLTFVTIGTQVLLQCTEISLKYLEKNFPNQEFTKGRILDITFPFNSTFYFDVTSYMNGTETSNLTKDDFNND